MKSRLSRSGAVACLGELMDHPAADAPTFSTGSSKTILIVDKRSKILSWAEDLAAAFEAEGCRVVRALSRSAGVLERCGTWAGKGKGLANPATCERIAQTMEQHRPDLVLFLNQAGLPKEAASRFRRFLPSSTPLASWLCDRPVGLRSGTGPHLDVVLYFDSACLRALEPAYRRTRSRLEFLPLAACARRYGAESFEWSGRLPRMAFAGHCSTSRWVALNQLRQVGVPLDVFGPGSRPRWFGKSRDMLSSLQLGAIYRRYFLNFNLLQPENTEHGLNLRAFEVAMAGGLGCYPRVPDLERSFVAGEEVVAYESLEDLVAQWKALVERPEIAARIAEAGWRRARRDHDFRNRAREILTIAG